MCCFFIVEVSNFSKAVRWTLSTFLHTQASELCQLYDINNIHWENYISISFQIEWDVMMVTVFLSILNQMEFHLVQNRATMGLQANQVPISSYILVASTTFKQLWNFKRNRKKLKYIYMIILELLNRLKQWADPTVTLFWRKSISWALKIPFLDARSVQTRHNVIWNFTLIFILSTLRIFYIKMATTVGGLHVLSGKQPWNHLLPWETRVWILFYDLV